MINNLEQTQDRKQIARCKLMNYMIGKIWYILARKNYNHWKLEF